jgi:hypothetical protein
MIMNEILNKLQNWFVSQCDGKWEHGHGLSIGTLDNPGWSVEIDLSDTQWEDAVWEDLIFENAPNDWINCSKKGAEFKGYGDGKKFEFILNHFLTQIGST